MKWLLICGGVSLDFIGGQRREVMHSRTRPTLLLSELLVRPHSLRRLAVMEPLRRVIVLWSISPGCIISVSLFHVSIFASHVFMLFRPIFGLWWELICIWCMLCIRVLCMCSWDNVLDALEVPWECVWLIRSCCGVPGNIWSVFLSQVTGSVYPEIFRSPKNKGKCCQNFSRISRISCLSKKVSWNKNNSNPG